MLSSIVPVVRIPVTGPNKSFLIVGPGPAPAADLKRNSIVVLKKLRFRNPSVESRTFCRKGKKINEKSRTSRKLAIFEVLWNENKQNLVFFAIIGSRNVKKKLETDRLPFLLLSLLTPRTWPLFPTVQRLRT